MAQAVAAGATQARGAVARDDGWDPRWELRPGFVPVGRYTSRAFFELELERLWPHVWQIACREDRLREPGDYVEHQIGRDSILVVRNAAGALRAFQNACRHRGRRLAAGCGRFEGRRIRCPFHGWTWTLDGANSHVFLAEEFAPELRRDEDLRLVECRVDTWGGFVWVNQDAAAPPLREAIGPGARFLEPAALERMGVLWHKVVELPINWKAALDAFTESYHVPNVHPEYPELGTDVRDFAYYAEPGGHSHYGIPLTGGEHAAAPSGVDERELFHRYVCYTIDEIGAMYTEKDRYLTAQLLRREIPKGSSAAAEYAKELQAYAQRVGIRLPALGPEELSHMGGNFLFPHFFCLPTVGNCLAYRARPNGLDPDSSIFDVWSLTHFPGDEKPRYEASAADWRDPAQVGRVLWQDFTNLAEVAAGMRTRGFDGLRLNGRQEIGILNMHRELDRYLRG
jgi:phenylpropionate dioxygenase-like ring-hydroxylating dioxygenase large terminal subunit